MESQSLPAESSKDSHPARCDHKHFSMLPGQMLCLCIELPEHMTHIVSRSRPSSRRTFLVQPGELIAHALDCIPMRSLRGGPNTIHPITDEQRITAEFHPEGTIRAIPDDGLPSNNTPGKLNLSNLGRNNTPGKLNLSSLGLTFGLDGLSFVLPTPPPLDNRFCLLPSPPPLPAPRSPRPFAYHRHRQQALCELCQNCRAWGGPWRRHIPRHKTK